MRAREIRRWIQRHGENPVNRPTVDAIPRPGDVNFNWKMRLYRRWVREYEIGELELAMYKPTATA